MFAPPGADPGRSAAPCTPRRRTRRCSRHLARSPGHSSPDDGRRDTGHGTRASWWPLQGSNLRHSRCKRDALPAELRDLRLTGYRSPGSAAAGRSTRSSARLTSSASTGSYDLPPGSAVALGGDEHDDGVPGSRGTGPRRVPGRARSSRSADSWRGGSASRAHAGRRGRRAPGRRRVPRASSHSDPRAGSTGRVPQR